jgi:hypothetical protein
MNPLEMEEGIQPWPLPKDNDQHLYYGRLVVCLSCYDLPNYVTPHPTLGTVGKPSMTWGAPRWFQMSRLMVHELLNSR